MKIQCPRCKEIVEMERFATSDEGLRFSCAACGERVFVENRRSLPPEAPATPPSPVSGPPAIPGAPGQIVCPKCGHAQDDPVACHRCGLMFSRFDPSLLPPDPPAAIEAWERVQRTPEDEAVHGAFLDACRAAGRLDVAARQYRIWSREPGREEPAKKMLERVAELGRASLAAPLAAGPREPTSIVTAARVLKWLVVLALLGGLTYAAVTLLSRSS